MSTNAKPHIKDNKHFASVLRRRLESHHASDTPLREILARLSDAELVEAYLRNEAQGRAHAARRAEKTAEAETRVLPLQAQARAIYAK